MNPISLSHLKKPSAVLAPSESSRQVGLEGLRNRPVPPIQPSSNNLRPAGKEGLPLCFFTWDNLHTANFFHSDTFHQFDLPQTTCASKEIFPQTTCTNKETFFTRPSFTNPTFLKQQPMLAKKAAQFPPIISPAPTGTEGLQLWLFTWSTFPFNPLLHFTTF